jgi:hypothetical protein
VKLGTRSLLFGVHAFWWHPVTVYRAWLHLYGRRPTLVETFCIFVHDFGYWGCGTMDGRDGLLHPMRGSWIARRIFGEKAGDLVLYHSRNFAQLVGREPSALCWPDKLSIVYDPVWFYLIRARLSGEIREYHLNAIKVGFVPWWSTQRDWLTKLRGHLEEMSRREARSFA